MGNHKISISVLPPKNPEKQKRIKICFHLYINFIKLPEELSN